MDNSVKTGVAPSFPPQLDLANVIPAVGASVGIQDIGKAIDFYKKNRTAIQAVLSFLGGLFGHKGSSTTTATPAPTPATTGEPTPTPAPIPTDRRRVAALKARYTLIERKRNLGEFGGGRYILPKDEFDAIINGDDPARPGDRLHVDITPMDQFGVAFAPGDAANDLLLKDVAAGQGEFNFRITHDVDGAEITSGYDDNGCTPVFLVPWEGEEIDGGRTWNVNAQSQWNGPKRETVQAPPLPTIRVVA